MYAEKQLAQFAVIVPLLKPIEEVKVKLHSNRSALHQRTDLRRQVRYDQMGGTAQQLSHAVVVCPSWMDCSVLISSQVQNWKTCS